MSRPATALSMSADGRTRGARAARVPCVCVWTRVREGRWAGRAAREVGSRSRGVRVCVRVRVRVWRCVGDGRAGLGASGRLAAGAMCARRQQLVHHLEAAAWPGPRAEGDEEEVLEEAVEEVVAEAN